MKPRVHNEWFQRLSKTTCECGCKKTEVYAWGEYAAARWRTILHFCQSCFNERVIPRLVGHATGCGCSFELKAKSGHTLPPWLKMPEPATCGIDMREISMENPTYG